MNVKAGQAIIIDGWCDAVVCDTRKDGTFYASYGDNERQRFEPADQHRVTIKAGSATSSKEK